MYKPNFKILQKQAYKYIKDLIISQSLDYTNIYSESKIALDMGISRTPVRDAIHRLYQEGYVDIIPNKGFVLHKMTEQDIMETYEIRSAIEGYCSRKIAREIHEAKALNLISDLKNSLNKQELILNTTKDIEKFATEDQYFHYLLVTYSENEAFNDIFGLYMYKIKKLACYSLSYEGRMLQTLKEHSAIFDAICNGDLYHAYEATLEHMKAPLGINLKGVYEEI